MCGVSVGIGVCVFALYVCSVCVVDVCVSCIYVCGCVVSVV